MPYVFQAASLRDGIEARSGSTWRVLGADDEPSESEVVLDELPPPGWVWDASAGEIRPRTTTEALAHAKAAKEAELRDAANASYQRNTRGFEGAIVAAKYGRSGLTALNAEERAVFDSMNASYVRLKDLIAQTRAATTIGEVEAVQWT